MNRSPIVLLLLLSLSSCWSNDPSALHENDGTGEFPPPPFTPSDDPFDYSEQYVPPEELGANANTRYPASAYQTKGIEALDDQDGVGITSGGMPILDPLSKNGNARFDGDTSEPVSNGFNPNLGSHFDSKADGYDPDLDPKKDPTGSRAIDVLDLRVPVADALKYPFSTVGMFANGCTGTLIGPRHVLTAGHCVFNRKTNKWYKNLAFMPARNGPAIPVRIAHKTAHSVKGWVERGKWEFDYGLVILAEDAPSNLGWMGFGALDDQSLTGILAHMIGYPQDCSLGSQWYVNCRFEDVGISLLTHKCRTFQGSSGSGMHRELGGAFHIYSVHSHAGEAEQVNVAVRLTPAYYRNIKGWIDSP